MLIASCRSLIYVKQARASLVAATLLSDRRRVRKPPFAVDEMTHVALHAVKTLMPGIAANASEAALEPPRFKLACFTERGALVGLGFELVAFRSRKRRYDDDAQLYAHWDNGYQGNSPEKTAVVGSAPSNQPSGRGHP